MNTSTLISTGSQYVKRDIGELEWCVRKQIAELCIIDSGLQTNHEEFSSQMNNGKNIKQLLL